MHPEGFFSANLPGASGNCALLRRLAREFASFLRFKRKKALDFVQI
jgi:hypothetical protein